MALETNKIHQGDCVENLKRVEAESVDLIFADPPFNIGYKYDVYDDRQQAEDYLAWCGQWINGCYQALKPTGTFWLAIGCLLYTSPSPRDLSTSRMPSSA